jgi:hypothetical protein
MRGVDLGERCHIVVELAAIVSVISLKDNPNWPGFTRHSNFARSCGREVAEITFDTEVRPGLLVEAEARIAG